ncbi:MAG: enoyl-CoA hydratase/isomerase family protein [Gemmatimonadales bacterium]
MSQPLVIVEAGGGIARLTLNRPDRLNAFDGVMASEMAAGVREITDRRDIRVIVVTGAGRGFCAGADLAFLAAALRAGRQHDAMELLRAGGDVVRQLAAFPGPVIASVNGAAAGGGASLALACDYRIAADSATIGVVFHRVGLTPDMGATWFLPRLVGQSQALELIRSAEMVPADRCLALGLVNRVVPAGQLASETEAMAFRLAALPRAAAAASKAAVLADSVAGLEAAIAREEAAQAACFRSHDAAEGLAAFLDKRAPAFQNH